MVKCNYLQLETEMQESPDALLTQVRVIHGSCAAPKQL